VSGFWIVSMGVGVDSFRIVRMLSNRGRYSMYIGGGVVLVIIVILLLILIF